MVIDLAVMHIGTLTLAALLLLWAAVSDCIRYRIPNRVCIMLLALFPLFVTTAPGGVDWHQHLLVFALTLIAGFIMFARNIAGAGDIKLLSVVGLWAGPHLIATFLFVTAIAGGVLGLVMAGLTWQRNKTRQAHQTVALTRVPLPYGVAIAVGGFATLMMLSHPVFFSN